VAVRRSESTKEAFGNWVAHFDDAQSREGLEAGVLLVSPMGQIHKYVNQLASPREDCTSSTAEFEGLLAGLRIAIGIGIFHLSIRGNAQLTTGQAEGVKLSPLMKAYVGDVQKLECHFNNFKLEHVPRGQDATVKEMSQIATQGLPVPAGATVEKLS
jgi:ribonuclease HI